MTKPRWQPLKRISSWRKISTGMWDSPRDPTIYGHETLEVTKVIKYLDEVSRISGEKVSFAAYLVKMVSTILSTFPELNVIVIGGQVLQRRDLNIFVQVAIPNSDKGAADLSGVRLENADKMDIVEVARKLRSRAGKVRAGTDEEMNQTKATVDKIPPFLMRRALKLMDFLTYVVPVDLDAIGIRSDPFGSAMITSVAQFGIELGYAPLVPASRCPLVFLPGAFHDAVFIENGKPVVRKGVTMSSTFDHRCYDGYQIGYIVRMVRDILANPEKYFPAPETWATEKPAVKRPRSPEHAKKAATPA